jgi:hypothetical protein
MNNRCKLFYLNLTYSELTIQHALHCTETNCITFAGIGEIIDKLFFAKAGNELGIFVLLSFIFSRFTAESHTVATKIMDRQT